MKFMCDNCKKMTDCKPVVIDGFTYCYCDSCKRIIFTELGLSPKRRLKANKIK